MVSGAGAGGGGGSSAGTSGNGNNGSSGTAGTAPTGGAAGGAGATSSANGSVASSPGGGGGGAKTSSSVQRNGGAGGTGKVTVTYTAAAGPAITGAATAAAFTTTYGNVSAAQTFAIGGTNLTADITATAPAGFEVSNDGATYGGTATFTQSGGSASGSLRIRITATAAVSGTYNSRNIVLSSTGATSVNVTTPSTGNAVTAKALTITGLAAVDKNYDATTTVTVNGIAAFSGLVNGDSLPPGGTVTWAFTDANVGTAKPLTRTGSYTVGTTNYSVTQPSLTASIFAVVATAPAITGITAGDTQLIVAFTPPASSGGATIANYEYSINAGASWAIRSPVAVTSPLIITGLVNGVSYDVQLRAINSAGSGAASASTSATPAIPPTLLASPSTLTGLNYFFGNGPSTAQSFNISGSNLAGAPGNLTVSGNSNYEVSSDNTSFGATATVPFADATLGNTPIYVRLKAGLAVATYNSQTITVAGGGATTQNVTVSGSVTLANDLSSNATVLTVNAAATTGTMVGATVTSPFTGNGDVWYQFTPAVTGTATVATVNNGQDLDLFVWSASPPAANSGSAASSTAGGTSSETVALSVSAGVPYYIRVLRFNGTAATFTIGVTIVAAAPSLTAAPGATIDTPFNVTFADNATWRGAISSITVGGNLLDPSAYSATTEGQITFTPSASTLLQSAGSKAIVVVATGYANATVTQSILAGVATKLGITTQPTAPTVNGGSLAVQPVVRIQDQYGNTTISTADVVANIGSGAWTLGGTTTRAAVAGTATFTGLTATSPAAVSGATISFTSGSLTGVTSSSFSIPVPTTVLAAGDIAVIALQTDDEDQFAFVNFVDLNPGTQITFTDNAWTGLALNSNESSVVWQVPSAGLSKGTVVSFINGIGFSVGSIVSGGFTGASTSGDQIIVYQGNAGAPAFIYALSSNTWITTGIPNTNNSYLPTGLINGTTARDFTTELDNQFYTPSTNTGSKAILLGTIGNTANWTRSDTRSSSLPAWAFTIGDPAISASGTLSALSSTYGTASGTTTFSLSGAFMNAGITVTPPAGFEVSTVAGSGFASSILVGAAGTISTTTVYVRLTATAGVAGSPYSGNIVLTSTGATSVNVATVASTVSAATLAPEAIMISEAGGVYSATSPNVSGFSISYSGRSPTSYGPSATVPTAAGLYTATATSSDPNYSGSKSTDYFIVGVTAANDNVTRQPNSGGFKIPIATLLGNDNQVDAGGALVQTGLSVDGVSSGTGNSVSVSGAFVFYTPTDQSAGESLTFTYTLGNGTSTATGTVTVATVAATAFSLDLVRVVTPAVFAAGETSMTVEFAAVPGQTYNIEYSPDMSSWVSRGAVATGQTGTFNVTFTAPGDLAAAWNSSMFFRATR